MNVESVVGWEEVFKVNAIAPFFVVREFSKLLIAAAEQRNATASVINVSSSAANLNATVVGNSVRFSVHSPPVSSSMSVCVRPVKSGS